MVSQQQVETLVPGSTNLRRYVFYESYNTLMVKR